MKKKECPSCAMEIDAKAETCPICQYEFSGFPKWITALAIFLLVIALFWIVF
jgi:RNA polymerase subunit RPABC4/transcription elongation factor Spt4